MKDPCLHTIVFTLWLISHCSNRALHLYNYYSTVQYLKESNYSHFPRSIRYCSRQASWLLSLYYSEYLHTASTTVIANEHSSKYYSSQNVLGHYSILRTQTTIVLRSQVHRARRTISKFSHTHSENAPMLKTQTHTHQSPHQP